MIRREINFKVGIFKGFENNNKKRLGIIGSSW